MSRNNHQTDQTLKWLAELKACCAAPNKWLGLELDIPLGSDDYPPNLMHLPNALVCNSRSGKIYNGDSGEEDKEDEKDEEEDEGALDVLVNDQTKRLNVNGVRGVLFAGPDIYVAYHCTGTARIALVASFSVITTPPPSKKQKPLADVFYSMSATLFGGRSVVKLAYNANTSNLEISKPIKDFVASRIGSLEPLQTQRVRFHGSALVHAQWFDRLGVSVVPTNVQIN